MDMIYLCYAHLILILIEGHFWNSWKELIKRLKDKKRHGNLTPLIPDNDRSNIAKVSDVAKV